VPELALQTWVGTPKQACTQESEKKGGDAHLVRFKVGLCGKHTTLPTLCKLRASLSVSIRSKFQCTLRWVEKEEKKKKNPIGVLFLGFFRVGVLSPRKGKDWWA
jgi:hypothetical protein